MELFKKITNFILISLNAYTCFLLWYSNNFILLALLTALIVQNVIYIYLKPSSCKISCIYHDLKTIVDNTGFINNLKNDMQKLVAFLQYELQKLNDCFKQLNDKSQLAQNMIIKIPDDNQYKQQLQAQQDDISASINELIQYLQFEDLIRQQAEHANINLNYLIAINNSHVEILKQLGSSNNSNQAIKLQIDKIKEMANHIKCSNIEQPNVKSNIELFEDD